MSITQQLNECLMNEQITEKMNNYYLTILGTQSKLMREQSIFKHKQQSKSRGSGSQEVSLLHLHSGWTVFSPNQQPEEKKKKPR